MRSGGARLAYGFKHLLDQLEMIGREGIGAYKIRLGSKIFERGAIPGKGKLVVQDILFGLIQRRQRLPGSIGLAQQAIPDDLVGVGAGQGQPCFEPPLDLGKVIGLAGLHLAKDGLDIGL